MTTDSGDFKCLSKIGKIFLLTNIYRYIRQKVHLLSIVRLNRLTMRKKFLRESQGNGMTIRFSAPAPLGATADCPHSHELCYFVDKLA